MTEQQYRVIADRDKGDDPTFADVDEGDRYTAVSMPWDWEQDRVDRIERPVPTPDDMTAMSHETTGFCFCGQMHGRVAKWSEADWDGLARIWREMQDEEQARRQVAEEAQRG